MVYTNPGIIKRGCEGLQTKTPVSDSTFWLIVLMKFPKKAANWNALIFSHGPAKISFHGGD